MWVLDRIGGRVDHRAGSKIADSFDRGRGAALCLTSPLYSPPPPPRYFRGGKITGHEADHIRLTPGSQGKPLRVTLIHEHASLPGWPCRRLGSTLRTPPAHRMQGRWGCGGSGGLLISGTTEGARAKVRSEAKQRAGLRVDSHEGRGNSTRK